MTDIFDVRLCDLVPEPMRGLPKVRALSYAMHVAAGRTQRATEKAMVNLDVSKLDIKVVDALAAEISAPYYDDSKDEATRRRILRDAMVNFAQAGTREAVERMLETVFGYGTVTEWFENGGEPYTYEIQTKAQITTDTVQNLEKMISKVTNTRSKLNRVLVPKESIATMYIGFGTQVNKHYCVEEGENGTV